MRRRRRDINLLLNRLSHHLSNSNHSPIRNTIFAITNSTRTHFSYSNTKLLCTNQSCKHSEARLNNPIEDFNSNKASVIAKSVLARCSHLWEKQGESFEHLSLKQILLKLAAISPKSVRPFWRVSTLRPDHVHELLLGFQFDSGNPEKEARKVEILWKLFKWGFEQNETFEHLPQSYEIMAILLMRVGMLSEAEFLLRTMQGKGIILVRKNILSEIIEAYASARELENAVSMYNWMGSHCLVPSELCFRVLLNLLIENGKMKLAYRVCMDMFETGFVLGTENVALFESVVKLHCGKGKVKEARNVCRRLVASGLEPSRVVLNSIADGYNEKKDFFDLLNFLKERKCAPDDAICNKILLSQCRNFGSEQAYLFMRELEVLGFVPDEATFGIFIGWSSREGKLKDTFVYLSELLSRGLKLDVQSYNALIGGVFKKGMWKHSKEIFQEMLEKGITPDLSTFKVLLAGYCKFRRFEEAKGIILEMVSRGLVQISPLEDPLSKAFLVLGFKPLAVKIKRDDNAGLQKSEFFDTLGNGLYLETDKENYEKLIMGILEDGMIPDGNSLILKECNLGNMKAALMLKDTMICRGQQLSLSAYSTLIKGLCVSRSHFSKAILLYEEVPDLVYQLDHETLNLLVRIFSKKGHPHKAMVILEKMLHRELPIESETYSALILGSCKKGCQRELHQFWKLAYNHEWLPSLKEFKLILGCLCQEGMLREVLELLESMLLSSIHSISDISNIFLEVLCSIGHASIGQIFLHEVSQERVVLNCMAYRNLLSGLCREENFPEAYGILDTMLENNMTPSVDVYSQLIPQLCKSQGLEKIVALKEIMVRKEPVSSIAVYYALIRGLCRGRKIGQAALQFQEMIAKGISPDSDTYNAMIQGYCQDNNLGRVRELQSVMVRNNINLSRMSYCSLMRLMCMHDRMSQALILKDVLLKDFDTLYVVVYNILLFRFLQTGKTSLVTALLEEMKRKGLVLDEVGYNFLIYGYSKCQDFSSSFKLLTTMIDKDLRPSKRSLRIVIRHLCNNGNLDKALKLSDLMELRGWVHGSVVQHAILDSLLSNGWYREAENYLKRIEDRDLIPNNVSYDSLILKFCHRGSINVPVNLLDIMLKKGNLPSSSCYDYVLQGFCIHKPVDDALNIHAEMLARDIKPSIRSWDLLIHKLCTDGRTAESERLLDCMIRLGQPPSQSIFQVVIDRFCLENNHNKASDLLGRMQQHGYVPDFKTHWSLISNLSNSNKENAGGGGFLSNLLSLSGFTKKKDCEVN